MKRVLAILTASLMASSLVVAPAFAQGNSGNGNGNGGGNGNGASASEAAPGQAKGDDGVATDFAPGQIKGDDESAKAYAPGQVKKDGDTDPDTTASTGQPNFGTLISSIRSGGSDFSSLETDAEVEVIDVDDLIKGNNRAALDNALGDSEVDEGLPDDLAALGLVNLNPDDAEDAVAARVEDDGSLTVFTDPAD